MDTSKINYVLPEDILFIIWKTYYSEYVLPIIKNKKESQLYLYCLDKSISIIIYNFAMNPLSYQPSGSVNLSKITNIKYITNI